MLLQALQAWGLGAAWASLWEFEASGHMAAPALRVRVRAAAAVAVVVPVARMFTRLVQCQPPLLLHAPAEGLLVQALAQMLLPLAMRLCSWGCRVPHWASALTWGQSMQPCRLLRRSRLRAVTVQRLLQVPALQQLQVCQEDQPRLEALPFPLAFPLAPLPLRCGSLPCLCRLLTRWRPVVQVLLLVVPVPRMGKCRFSCRFSSLLLRALLVLAAVLLSFLLACHMHKCRCMCSCLCLCQSLGLAGLLKLQPKAAVEAPVQAPVSAGRLSLAACRRRHRVPRLLHWQQADLLVLGCKAMVALAVAVAVDAPHLVLALVLWAV